MTVPPPLETPLLAMSDIVKEYRGVAALKNIDFDLRRGEVHAILGENGAGKSTFLKILSGEIDPTKGTIEITPGERMAVLNQNHFAFDECTVLNTVLMGHQKMWTVMQEISLRLSARQTASA